MTVWCCINKNRVEKTSRIMKALAAGWPGGRTVLGHPPNDGSPFITWGQIWLAEELIKAALPAKRQFYQIDNGFWKPGRGQGMKGYYRFLRQQPNPVQVHDHAWIGERMDGHPELMPEFKPWRKTGTHVLIAMPGLEFGRAYGLNMAAWCDTIIGRVVAATDRPIQVRHRLATMPLSENLRDCWCVITHSSNVAVDAILAGIPVFVEDKSMALPVGNILGCNPIEDPWLPSPERLGLWWGSLMCQQFSIDEMRRGIAHRFLTAIHGPLE